MPSPLRLLCLALTLSLVYSPSVAMGGEIRLAVAANFHGALQALTQRFEQDTGHSTRVSYGSTGKLYAQIRQGAPFDVFMAADQRRPELLEAAGLIHPGSRFTYAIGKLVLWSPSPEAFTNPMVFLQSNDNRRLAMANPATAPYGFAARQVLKSLALWDQIGPAMVRGESIAQTFQFVDTGNARGGFVALSQLEGKVQSGSIWHIPDDLYQPIVQQAVLLRHSSENPAARAWVRFLQAPDTQRLIRRHGYDLPSDLTPSRALEQP